MKKNFRNICTLLFLLIISGIELAQSNSKNFSDSLLTLCKKYYNEGSYKQAADLYRDKESNKFSAEELFYTGLSLNNIHQTIKAAGYLHKAVELSPSNHGYKLQFARALTVLGKTKEAATVYNEIIKNDSTNIPALHELGMIFINSKEFYNSKNIFKKLANLNRFDYLANYYVAYSMVYSLDKDTTESAEPYLEQSISNNPEYVPAIELLAYFNFNNKKYYEANLLYSIARILNPENADFNYRSGLCYEKLKLYREAVEYFSKAALIDSSAANYFDHLGYAQFILGRFDSCIAAYKKAAKLDENNPSYFLNLGYAYARLDSAELSIKSFERALKILPTDKIGIIYSQIAAIYYSKENYKDAKEAYVKTLLYQPNNIDALFYLAIISEKMKDYRNASTGYKKVIELAADDSQQSERISYANNRIKEIKKITR